MKTITLDNCEHKITTERLERLLVSGAVVKSQDFNEDGLYFLNCWHNFTYQDVCRIIKGPD